MAFVYERMFVVFNAEGELQDLYVKRDNAELALPEHVRHFPQELSKGGAWAYGRGPKKWRIEYRKVRDSAGIPDGP